MAWAEIENYRQLRQEYEKGREQFVAEESAYREAAEKGAEDEAEAALLMEQYKELVSKRTELASKLETLKEIRSTAAQRRDEVAQAAVL